MADERGTALANLRNYLKIRSVHPNVNYDECITFLRQQASDLDLYMKTYELVPKKPIVILTLQGEDPTLPSILLNSHMDVVPVFEKSWIYPPFDAHVEDGVIYGRGVQDMKSVAIQYIEAVRRLKNKGIKLKRNLHLSFVPEEEVGGRKGMGEFVKCDHFKTLNIGFALDEGIANAGEEFLIFNGERTIWHVNVTCKGLSGHGSLLLPDNCGEKLRYIIDKFMDVRQESKDKLKNNPELSIGDVTTVNLTMVHGGIQNNVVPEKMTASFDIRLALSVDLNEFENTIKRWCTEAGDKVTYDFFQKDTYVPPTKLDESNPYYMAFKDAAKQLKITVKPRTFPGGTDSRYIRQAGIPAIGFSPMNNTEPGLHTNNESLRVDTFLRGIEIYEKIIPAIANV